MQAEGPYLLGGYCFGGIVVYEIAQQLKAAGDEVELLCLFDTDNPSVAPRYLSLAERASRQWTEKLGQILGRPRWQVERTLRRRLGKQAQGQRGKSRCQRRDLHRHGRRS